MNIPDEIIADSSFYICFLDDINKPKILLRIINRQYFILPPIVKKEISRSKKYFYISTHKNLKSPTNSFDYSALLTPFFSEEEIVKGEHQVIAIAHMLYLDKKQICIILDDESPRKFVIKNFNHLSPSLTGTVGFIYTCCVNNIFTKDEAKATLDLIEKSEFRISKKIIQQTKYKIDAS